MMQNGRITCSMQEPAKATFTSHTDMVQQNSLSDLEHDECDSLGFMRRLRPALNFDTNVLLSLPFEHLLKPTNVLNHHSRRCCTSSQEICWSEP